MSTNKELSERRQYYRIDDSGIFSYQVLNNSINDEQSKTEKSTSATFETIELFSQINQQMSVALGRINEHSADIAAYLKGLDKKVELLTQMFLFKESGHNIDSRRQINLSAGGLAFAADEKLKQGTLIAMDMILSTDLLCLHLTGRVIQVSNNKDGDFPYRVSVGFTDISELEVDQIIKHIMRMQSKHLREKRES